MCGMGLRHRTSPVGLAVRPGPVSPTDLLGCLSHPGDVLAEAYPLPPLAPGDVVAFPNAGAYGLCASPWSFNGHPIAAEVVFDGKRIETIRSRPPTRAVLEGQMRLRTVEPLPANGKAEEHRPPVAGRPRTGPVSALPDQPLFIGGQWVDSVSG